MKHCRRLSVDNKFKDLFTALCYDEPHDCFVIPSLTLIPAKPEINKEQFEKDLVKIWEYCEETRKQLMVLNWENDIRVLREVVQEVFFDGNGYAIPYFGVYINEKPQDQVITDIKVVRGIIPGRVERIPVTDFAKDTVMAKFVSELYFNLSSWEVWLKNKKAKFGQQIPEFTHQLNEDGYGKKKLAEPYEKKIDELMDKQEKNG